MSLLDRIGKWTRRSFYKSEDLYRDAVVHGPIRAEAWGEQPIVRYAGERRRHHASQDNKAKRRAVRKSRRANR